MAVQLIILWLGGDTSSRGITPGKLKGIYEMSGIELRLAECKANVLPTCYFSDPSI